MSSTPMPLPDSEAERLASLLNMQVLDTPAEDRFDRLTRLGCRLLRASFAMLTLIDQTRQWFKPTRGHLLLEAPRAVSFCTHTILEPKPMVRLQAAVDPLTRCWNQETILALVSKERLQSPLSLLVVGLQGLPAINQRWGQPVGDGVLREMSDRLREALASGDLLGRLNGPRFLVLTHAPLAQVEALAKTVIHSVSYRVVVVGDHPTHLNVSVGVASLRGPTDRPREALARAEKAERSSDAGGVVLSI